MQFSVLCLHRSTENWIIPVSAAFYMTGVLMASLLLVMVPKVAQATGKFDVFVCPHEARRIRSVSDPGYDVGLQTEVGF